MVDWTITLQPPWIIAEIIAVALIIGERNIQNWFGALTGQKQAYVRSIKAADDKPVYHYFKGVGLAKFLQKDFIKNEPDENGKMRTQSRYYYTRGGEKFNKTLWSDQIRPASKEADAGLPFAYFDVDEEENKEDKLKERLKMSEAETQWWQDEHEKYNASLEKLMSDFTKQAGKMRDDLGPKYIYSDKKKQPQTMEGGEEVETK
jgi:hypothetical protein